MQTILNEMQILSKCVKFKNLTSAALHVGLSQPQLSRILSKIEHELDVTLLDRTSKRNSNWTEMAYRLTEVYQDSIKKLEHDIVQISENFKAKSVHIGTLEGLSDFAIKAAYQCFNKLKIKEVSIEILDLNELEARFTSDQLDIIITMHEPGRQKYKYIKNLGFQNLEIKEINHIYSVQSSFESLKSGPFSTKEFQHHLITNSLEIKTQWLNQFGGTGLIPGPIVKNAKSNNMSPVIIIGSDLLHESIWKEIIKTQ